jgi:hypothetical protein
LEKENFDSLEKENFDSLKRKILTFERKILTAFPYGLKFPFDKETTIVFPSLLFVTPSNIKQAKIYFTEETQLILMTSCRAIFMLAIFTNHGRANFLIYFFKKP